MDKKTAFELIKKYIEFLKTQKYSVAEAYLFGSYAKGTYSVDSDIDLALIFNGHIDTYETQIALMKLRRDFDLRIEPHPFEKSDVEQHDPFLEEIIRTGIRV